MTGFKIIEAPETLAEGFSDKKSAEKYIVKNAAIFSGKNVCVAEVMPPVRVKTTQVITIEKVNENEVKKAKLFSLIKAGDSLLQAARKVGMPSHVAFYMAKKAGVRSIYSRKGKK